MHPIEGFMYDHAAFMPCMFLHHPLMIYIVKLDLNLKAAFAHDGYDYPGHGRWFHYIHHRKFNCNFGTPNAPLDWLFGSYNTGEELYQKEEKAVNAKLE